MRLPCGADASPRPAASMRSPSISTQESGTALSPLPSNRRAFFSSVRLAIVSAPFENRSVRRVAGGTIFERAQYAENPRAGGHEDAAEMGLARAQVQQFHDAVLVLNASRQIHDPVPAQYRRN